MTAVAPDSNMTVAKRQPSNGVVTFVAAALAARALRGNGRKATW